MSTPELAAAALIAGLASSVHCVGMCGGIVGALQGVSAPGLSPLRLHLAYGLGRVGAYAGSGTVAGALAGAVASGGAGILGVRGSLIAQSTFAAVAGVMLVAMGLYLAGLLPGLARIERAGLALWRRLEPFGRRLLPVRSPARALALGALWGFLPCGLVYTMLVTAAAAGSAQAGAAVMVAFGLGTLPAMLAVGLWVGRFQSVMRRRGTRLAAGLAVVAFGLHALVSLALSLAAGGGAHEHPHHAGGRLESPQALAAR